jgi:hypothetical protein
MYNAGAERRIVLCPGLEETMRAKVTARGLLIPIELLKGVREVDIRQQADGILVVPVPSADPILQLGTSPVVVDEHDAAENHDRYIYSQ